MGEISKDENMLVEQLSTEEIVQPINETEEEFDMGDAKEKPDNQEIEQPKDVDGFTDNNVAYKDSTPRKNSKKPIIIGIIAVIVLAIIGGIIYNSNQNKIVEISAEFTGRTAGDTAAGVVLDESNTQIKVIGIKKNGEKVQLSSGLWEIKEPATLETDKESTITVLYKDLETPLTVQCSTSAIVDFEATYKGSTIAGTEINDKSNFSVTVKYKNGKESNNYTNWKLKAPTKLEADSSVEVEVIVEELSKNIVIECSTKTPVKITAKYEGDIKPGIVLDEKNKGIIVTAEYKNGNKEQIKDFKVKKSKTIEAGNNEIIIQYMGLECSLSVKYEAKAILTPDKGLIMDAYEFADHISMFLPDGLSVTDVEDDGFRITGHYKANESEIDVDVDVLYDNSKGNYKDLIAFEASSVEEMIVITPIAIQAVEPVATKDERNDAMMTTFLAHKQQEDKAITLSGKSKLMGYAHYSSFGTYSHYWFYIVTLQYLLG